MIDFGGDALMIDAFANTKTLVGDKVYDADQFRDALAIRKIEARSLLKIQSQNLHLARYLALPPAQQH